MDLLEVARQRRLLLEAGVIERLSSLAQPEAFEVLLEAEKKASQQNLFVISNALVEKILSEKTEEKKAAQAPIYVEKPQAVEKLRAADPSFKHELQVLSLKTFDCSGGAEDFVLHFRNRLEKISKILRTRTSENGITTINRIKSSLDRRKTRVIGMVESKRQTQKGNYSFELEDETGMIKCIVSTRDKKMWEEAQDLWLDEVLAVDGAYANGLFLVESLVFPDVPIRPKKTLGNLQQDVGIAFMSDLHVGSRFFMQKEFEKALEFFNGVVEGEEEKRISKTIKYLIIAGDVVDGVGVYPSQEKQLVTKNIFEQYSLLGEYLKSIPDDIQVVIAPGNHDAVRDAEPQPSLPSEFVESFSEPNFHFVPNPCYLDIHGIKILIYHGTSADALISNSEGLGDAFEHTEKIAVEMLRRRHLSPLYGEKPMIPSREDGMVVDEIPDIFHFGHLHRNCLYEYNGTVIINSGTWQSMTDYEEKMGRKPTPCLLPVYNIRAGSAKILDFNERE